jgi:D-alanyl-D-alanine carboxypeptidase
MAGPDDLRPRRRPVRRVLASVIVAVGFLAVGVGLSAVALSGLRQPTDGPGPAALATEATPDASSAASPGAPAPTPASATPTSAAPSPTPEPTDPGTGPKTRAELRALAVRTRLQGALDEARVRLGVPGVSVTIIFRDGSRWTGTSGLADVAGNVEVAPDTAFAIASVSKTYTAALILSLVEDGRVDLDTSALRYIPEAALDQRITIRQLLDHTSGLDDFFLHTPIDKALLADRDAFWSVKRTLKYVAKPYFPPGRGWHYSNTNYVYLGLIAERVTGVPLATALRERFFAPLDLDATWYQAVEKPRGPLAHGYRFAGRKLTSAPIDLASKAAVAPFTSVISAAGGAGSIAATSSDAARWARLLYTGRILGSDMTAAMLDGVALTAGYDPRVPYGLGVQAFPIAGRLAVGHSGRLLGFRSSVRHLPGEALTIAVLTNQSRADPAVIVEDLLSVIFAPSPPCNRCQRPT